jgi:hypothetical protein
VQRSHDRILSTHMGSLPQSPALHARLMARAASHDRTECASATRGDVDLSLLILCGRALRPTVH